MDYYNEELMNFLHLDTKRMLFGHLMMDMLVNFYLETEDGFIVNPITGELTNIEDDINMSELYDSNKIYFYLRIIKTSNVELVESPISIYFNNVYKNVVDCIIPIPRALNEYEEEDLKSNIDDYIKNNRSTFLLGDPTDLVPESFRDMLKLHYSNKIKIEHAYLHIPNDMIWLKI